MRINFKKYAANPWCILIFVVLGMLTGYSLPIYQNIYSTISNFYLSLLEMCVLPVMSCAVISSLGHLIHNGETLFYLKRIMLVFLCSLLGVGIFGILVSVTLHPGLHLSQSGMIAISKAVAALQGQVADVGDLKQLSFWDFFYQLVPSNIFSALAEGQNISILFISVLVGIAVGIQRTSAATQTLSVLHTIYLAFINIISWILVALPFGLFFLFAGYVAEAGFGLLSALSEFILLLFGCGLFLMIVYTFIISYRTGFSPLKIIVMLKQPLMLAFFTASSYATLPTTLNALQRNFKLDSDLTSLVVPLGTNFNPQASVIRYICVAFFIAQMYGVPITFSECPLLLLTAIFVSLAGAGLPGLAAITMAKFVFQPLGLPTEIGLILLILIEPIIDPAVTMVNVFGNCMAVTMVVKPNKAHVNTSC